MTLRQAVAVALFASLGVMACSPPNGRAGQDRRLEVSGCPEDDVLETLHDAAFFLEHRRDVSRVARDLEKIRRQVSTASPGAAMVLPLIQRISSLAARDGVLEPESELIRAELHASPCITAEAHERFHRALPPLRKLGPTGSAR